MVEGFDCTNIDLHEGSKGAQVSLLQKYLKQLGYYTYYKGHYLMIDGDFGTYTAWALRKFQGDTRHSQDAQFGPKTCKSLNEKIGATTTSSSSSSSSSSSTTTKSTPQTVQKKHVIQNVFTKDEANLHIEGVHLIASTVNPTTHFKKGNWKTVELVADGHYTYKGHTQLREYSVECYLTHKQFKKLEYDLNLLTDKICRIVSDTMITAGYYTVNITVAEERVMEKKITLKLTETKKG